MSIKRSDIFRFMAIREPNKLGDVDAVRINASGEGQDTSILLKALDDSHQSDDPIDSIEKIARDYVNNKLRGATVYTTSMKSLDARLPDLGAKIYGKPTKNKVSIIKSEIDKLGITDENLIDWKNRLYDSYHAALVLRKERSSDLRRIQFAIRVIDILSQVKSGAIHDSKLIPDALKKTIIVSKTIVSLAKHKNKKKDDEREKISVENEKRLKSVIEEYESNYKAIEELTLAYDKDWEIRRFQQKSKEIPSAEAREIPPKYYGIVQKLGRWIGITPILKKTTIPARKAEKNQAGTQSVLSEEITKGISLKTKERLQNIGSNPDNIEASLSIKRLEEKNLSLLNNIKRMTAGSTVAMFGGQPMLDFGLAGEVVVDTGVRNRFVPGECPTQTTKTPLNDDESTFKKCRFNSLGIGELQVVKQKLIGYEVGEIAHIETVMATEKRSRKHRTLHRTEEFTSFEFEREEETERDLETTTRFELQKEIEKEVSTNTQKEAGVTVTGSYGPTVEFSANAGIASDNSSSKTESLSTNYSKEVVDRSIQRIQEKIKEKRTLLTIDEVEVINKHSFTNQGNGAVDINGVYKWVNKKYEAQVFNYGKRQIIEIIVPEPAAFLRYLGIKHPREGSTITKPIKPGYCVSGGYGFVPLSPGTITETNYLDWVAAYNIQDIKPPPPKIKWETTVLKSEATAGDDSDPTDTILSVLSDDEFTVPSGYLATEAWFCINLIGIETRKTTGTDYWIVDTTSTTTARTYGDITIGNVTTYIITGSTNNPQHIYLNREDGKLPIAATVVSPFPLNATVEVKCILSNEALMEWKLSTYEAIMSRYQVLLDEYEDAISGEDSSNEVDIKGKNPLENQQIIQNELKRLVITQITGQTFDGFDAMIENVGEYGYPQHDVDEAWSEGRYIRFIEQAFEWENLQYLFYPYYWGKKKDWPLTSQLEDVDPLFKAFLQAGSSRINLAVRPGFESSVNTFLSTGKLPWDSNEGVTLVECLDLDSDQEEIDPFLTITEEMKAQQGAVYFKSNGTVSHLANDPSNMLTGDMVEDRDDNGEVLMENGNPVLINGTDFSLDDINREINIGGKIYMINTVDVPNQKITLNEALYEPDINNAPYGIGAKAIGVPWVVTIPTSLVILGDGSDLPDYS